jgi:ABC-type transport system substrate-binding protein
MADLTKIFASFRARQLTMTGIGRHLERPEADILKKDFPDAVVALGPRGGWNTFVMNLLCAFTCDAPFNLSQYCNPEFDQLFAEQSRTFEVQKRAEITRQMERMLLQEVPDDRGFYWKSAMG